MNREKTPRLIALFFALLALTGIFSNYASAQILDDIAVREDKDEVVIAIQLAAQVQYKRHAPVKQGQTLDIYYQLIQGTSASIIDENETRLSPPSTLISDFTVASKMENGELELVVQFDRELHYRVTAAKDSRGFLIYVKKSSIGKVVPAKRAGDFPEIKPEASDDQNTKQAAVLLTEGSDALQAGDFPAAIAAFNKLLELPSNKYTQDAQEWVGVAREGIGQTDKARLEYESYLKAYSAGAGVTRVKARLAKLPAAVVAGAPVEEKKKAATKEVYGNFGMHYYHGASTVDTTTTNVITNTLTQSAFTNTDQSSVVTQIDITERFRSDEYDNRLSFNDAYTKNYVAGQANRNRVNNAYFEVKSKLADYNAKFGRQSANGGGVLGKFDGAFVEIGATPMLHPRAVVGRLADTSSNPVTQPVFYGAELKILDNAERGWDASIYAINQTLEGFADRRAVGGEARFFGAGGKSVGLSMDYDTTYKALNWLLLTGGMESESGTRLDFMLDRRKSPSLGIRNALTNSSGAVPTLGELSQSMSLADMQKLAKDRTATATLGSVGITHPMTDKWQVAGDIKFAKTSSLDASGTPNNPDGTIGGIEGFNSDPGTGKEWTFEGKLIGSNIFSAVDINVISLSRITSPATNAQSLFVNNRTTVAAWTYEASLRVYRQDNLGIAKTRLTPAFKVVYLTKKRVNLEAEGTLESTRESGNGTSSKTTQKSFNLGFRWDFG